MTERLPESSWLLAVAAVGLWGARAPQLLHSLSRNTLHKMPEPQYTCTCAHTHIYGRALCCNLELQRERPCHCTCQDPGTEGILTEYALTLAFCLSANVSTTQTKAAESRWKIRNATEKTQCREDDWNIQLLVKLSFRDATNVYISNICPDWFLYYEHELWALSAQYTV